EEIAEAHRLIGPGRQIDPRLALPGGLERIAIRRTGPDQATACEIGRHFGRVPLSRIGKAPIPAPPRAGVVGPREGPHPRPFPLSPDRLPERLGADRRGKTARPLAPRSAGRMEVVAHDPGRRGRKTGRKRDVVHGGERRIDRGERRRHLAFVEEAGKAPGFELSRPVAAMKLDRGGAVQRDQNDAAGAGRRSSERRRRGGRPAGYGEEEGGEDRREGEVTWPAHAGHYDRGKRSSCDAIYRPVEPKPPEPRSLSSSASASCHSTLSTRAKTNWAMRSPRRTANGSAPWLIRITPTSPR